MRHTICFGGKHLWRAHTSGGMFSGRGYNIDSLNVAPTHDPEKSRMIVTWG